METQLRAQSLSLTEALVYFFLGFAFLILETTAWTWVDPDYCRPNFILILIVYFGLAVPIIPGSILSVLFGLLTDVATGGPLAMFTLNYLAIFGVTIFMRQKLDPAASLYQILVVLFLAALSQVMIWGFLSLYGWPFRLILEASSAHYFITQAVSVLLTALLSPLFFRFFERIRSSADQRTGETA